MELTVKGLNTYYTVEGSGPAVLVLEGWGTNTAVYAPISSLLSGKYTVYTLDFPGFGRSEEPKEVWDVGMYADFTVEFAKALGIKEVILIGHSFGGRVIFKLHEKELPFDVPKIVLIDSAGVKPPDTLKKKIKRTKYKIARKCLELFAPSKVEKYRLAHSSADYQTASPMMREVLKKTVSEDLRSLFSKVTAPTLLIWGKNDTATPLSDGQLMEKSMKDAGLVVLEGGHYSYLDSPTLFARVMTSFFAL